MNNNLMLASMHADRLALWKQGLTDFESTTAITDSLDTLKDNVERLKPHILLLDFDLLGLNGSNSAAGLKRLSAETSIIILSGEIPEDVEWELFKIGVRGCCRNDIKPDQLNYVVVVVQQGELWMRRKLTCRLLDEFSESMARNKAYRESLSLLDKLTQREYDIAVRVSKGENNKQIAQACAITERTVKAHLTEVFQKLRVPDRVNLALLLSADRRTQRRVKSSVDESR
jgi:two-component system NarL family response regulator